MAPIHSARLPGLSVFASSHAAGSILPWHTHEGATVCCVLDGAFTEYWRGHVLECTSATVKVTPAGEPHWNRFGEAETRGLMVEVQRELMGHSRRIADALDGLVHLRDGEAASISRRIWRELGEHDIAASLALEGLVLELLASLVRTAERDGERASHTPAPWLRMVRERLHEQDTPPSLQDVAAEAGVHPATLTRAFRRAYGSAPGEYVRRLRIERALHAVAHSDAPLAEIAVVAGFSDQAHFTRAFRRATGWTPGAYRKGWAMRGRK